MTLRLAPTVISSESRSRPQRFERVAATSRICRNSRRPGHRQVYDVDEIDSFFVIDAELNAFWIPFRNVCGYGQISLRNYRSCLVAERGQWLVDPQR